jgi:hypothetical protein
VLTRQSKVIDRAGRQFTGCVVKLSTKFRSDWQAWRECPLPGKRLPRLFGIARWLMVQARQTIHDSYVDAERTILEYDKKNKSITRQSKNNLNGGVFIYGGVALGSGQNR